MTSLKNLWDWWHVSDNRESVIPIIEALGVVISVLLGLYWHFKRKKASIPPELPDRNTEGLAPHSPSQPSVNQSHSGTGDNIAGNQTKIGRRINQGAHSTYNENRRD